MKINQHVAQGANLIFFIPTCVTAIIVNIRNKNINYDVAKTIIVTGVIGAIIGAKLSVKLPIQELKKYFGIFLIIVAINEIYLIKKEYINYKKMNNKKRNLKRRD